MDYTELLPPLPKTEYMLGIPASHYTREWVFNAKAWEDCAVRAYALAAIAAAAPAIRGAERERAAAVCELFAYDIAPSGTSHPQCDAMSEGAYQCAAAIRALPEEP